MNARDTNQPSDIHVDYYTKEVKQTILGNQMVWRPFKPSRYKVRLTQKEIDWADNIIEKHMLDSFMIINPDYKSTFSLRIKTGDLKNIKKWPKLYFQKYLWFEYNREENIKNHI